MAVLTTYATSAVLIFQHYRNGDGYSGRVALRSIRVGGIADIGGWADPHHIVLCAWPAEAGPDTLEEVNLRYAPQSTTPLPLLPRERPLSPSASELWEKASRATYPGLLDGLQQEFEREVVTNRQRLTVEASGWPHIALRASRLGNGAITEGIDEIANAGMANRDGWMVPRYDWRIPYRPIWPGFAVNTGYAFAFWITAWFIAARSRGSVTRWWRRRRDRCVACGYPRKGLASSAACPECGGGASATKHGVSA